MKFSHKFIALLSIPVLCASAMAAESAGVLEGTLPVDSLIKGRVIRPAANPDLAPIMAEVQAKFNSLPDDQKKAIAEKRKADSALDYFPELWDSKKDYDTYLAAWGKNSIQERENVAIGLKASEKPGVWNIVSATIGADKKTAPLTLSALHYNSTDNTWTSNNGVLTCEEVSEGANFIFGAQTGHQWTLTDDGSLSTVIERVRITKSTDGKYIFVYYNFLEQSKASGKIVAQGAYSLRFPVTTPGTSLTTPGQR